MKICFVSSEVEPFVKTGGLADVSGALPVYLSKLNCEVDVFLPFYDVIDREKFTFNKSETFGKNIFSILNREIEFNLYETVQYNSNVRVFLIECPYYFNREKVYTNDADEDERFIFFQNAVLISIQKMQIIYDVIHCNDWQTGLIPAFIKKQYKNDYIFSKTAILFTIHNIAYQGIFEKSTLLKANFSEEDFIPGGAFELNGNFCFLKAGISFADIISTVSLTYSDEIQTSEYGCGLEGVLLNRKSDLFGILNGIDDEIWNPEKDKFLNFKYNFNSISEKYKNKNELFEYAGFEYNESIPALGIVSRFAWQKGFDLYEYMLEDLLKNDIRIFILGKGEEIYEKFFRDISKKYKNKLAVFIEFNNKLSHLITAGSDIFLMPSKYEPCGLNQMYSLKYGTVPIVRKTGGLADTVKDVNEYGENGNGFTFYEQTPEIYLNKIEQALETFRNKKKWNSIINNGMNSDFTWNRSAKKYIELYNKALIKKNNKPAL